MQTRPFPMSSGLIATTFAGIIAIASDPTRMFSIPTPQRVKAELELMVADASCKKLSSKLEKLQLVRSLLNDTELVQTALQENLHGVELTKIVHRSIEVHQLTLLIVCYIEHALSLDAQIGPLLKKGDVIVLMKGGQAHKRSLKLAFPKEADKIERVFGSADTDVSILVNPSIPDFEVVRSHVVELTWLAMRTARLTEISDLINKQITERMTSDELAVYKPHDNRDYISTAAISNTRDGDKRSLTIHRRDRSNPHTNPLTLIQLKKEFIVVGQVNAKGFPVTKEGDILDVAIPFTDSADFHKVSFVDYRNGSLATTLSAHSFMGFNPTEYASVPVKAKYIPPSQRASQQAAKYIPPSRR